MRRGYVPGMITEAAKWVYLLVLAVWVGGMIFFSFVVAPTVFRTLSPEHVGQLMRRLFPRYYLVGMLCAVLGIVCVAALLAAQAMRMTAAVFSLLLIAGMGAAQLWMRQAVAPQMNGLRQQVAESKAAHQTLDRKIEEQWQTLHRLSVQVNGAVLVCGLALLFLLVYSRAV